MKNLNIIPSPQYVFACLGEENAPLERIKTIYVSDETERCAEAALKFLPSLEKMGIECADLIITTEKAVAEKICIIDEKWFENPNAMEQGYIIKGLNDGRILVFAHSYTGIMYAISTLIQIPAIKYEFEIKDYPDFRYRGNKWLIWAEIEVWSYDYGDGIEEYKKRIIRKFDLCLKYKVNMILFDGWGADTERTPHYKELIRYFNKEARKRGIYLIFSAYTMSYGLSAHKYGKHFGKVYKNISNYPNGEEYSCIGTTYVPGRKFGTCLSNDALMEDKLEELRNFVREVQPGALYLHNFDAHLIYADWWIIRCDECRKKWPNDDLFAKDGMAGAFAYFFDRLNGGLKDITVDDYDSSRDLLIFNVSPGYMSDDADDSDIEISSEFWKKVLEYSTVKKNVFPTFREMYCNKEDKRLRVADILNDKLKGEQGYGIINFSGGDGFYTDKLFFVSSVLNYMFKGAEALITCSGNSFQEPLQLFNAEYMWNSTNSSFYNIKDVPDDYEQFMKFYKDCRFTRFRPDEIYKDGGMLDIICEKLYGENADVMSKFFKLRGENNECPVPFACNKETRTNGNSPVISFRWDNEMEEEKIEKLIDRFEQINQVNNEALALLEKVKESDCDIASYFDMLSLNAVLVSYWCDYLNLYLAADRFIKKNIGDKAQLMEKAEEGILKARTERKHHIERKFNTVDAMDGALSRREEMLGVMEYNFGLIKRSLETGKRMPDDIEITKDGAWW